MRTGPLPTVLSASWPLVGKEIKPYLFFIGPVPAGYGELWMDDVADEVEMARIFVAPEYRGKGIGTALVRALLDLSVNLGYGDVILRVRPDNEAAIRT
jgi:ribosomal protein S18 acetylase RimI-like enzyme